MLKTRASSRAQRADDMPNVESGILGLAHWQVVAVKGPIEVAKDGNVRL